ncbi:hypothetical protein M0805_005771 [Coniferiporia weirii]|nr:hypothetical protein M0805_005771 [Coniferiporia weirii]
MSPALAAHSSPPSSSKGTGALKPVRRAESAHAQPRARRTRVVRRRGRGRLDGLDSDDEIERDAMSDASGSEEPSLVDSDSEPESDAESVLLRNGRHHPDTPSTTQSPPPAEIKVAAALEGFAVAKPDRNVGALEPPRSAPAFLSSGMDWSDMVADESAGVNGAEALPVIDFTDLHTHAVGDSELHSSPTARSDKVEIVALDDDGQEGEEASQQETERPRHNGFSGPRPPPGHSARQAYQQRLQTDPQFVPTLGEFWGHDDRLMQKDLRSLSGWWRGRWQGRGRGRGGFVSRGMRGRGRGAYFEGPGRSSQDGNAAVEVESSQPDSEEPSSGPNLPPIEKFWTHDGFEEMKARDERRGAVDQQRGGKPNTRLGPPAGAQRGGFVPRGRGTFTQQRGAFLPQSQRGRPGVPFVNIRLQPDRVWFAMKPERIWTKQYEGFLYLDPSLKPKPGRPAGYRVSMPGKGTEVIRVSAPTAKEEPAALRSQAPSEAAAVTDASAGRRIIVNVPRRAGKEKAEDESSRAQDRDAPQPEPFTTAEELFADPPAAAPAADSYRMTQPPAPSADIGPPAPATAMTATNTIAFQPPSLDHSSAQNGVMATPSLTRDNSLSEKSVATDIPTNIAAQPAPLSVETGKAAEIMPSGPMPPMQTLFPPPTQPSPTYGPPYAYAPTLPPGIALNQQGYAYEVASGRPVYLHATPPPPMPLYTPRPLPFVPGHMHHSSLSADFMQGPPATPPLSIVDPATGRPLFSLPRQNSRIEIRAPSDTQEGRGKHGRRPSGLRSATLAPPGLHDLTSAIAPPQSALAVPPGLARYASAPEFFPSHTDMSGGASPHVYQSSEGAASLSPGHEERPLVTLPALDPGMMGYPGFQQQYYYPEQYYPAYMEVPQQPAQYDQYVVDQHHQPPVYY